ncbi:MAG: phenylacetate--CoA ligase family protein [Armatimonadota bacterium]
MTGFPDREQIEARQLLLLQELVAELVPSNRFYTRKLEPAGLAGGVPDLAAFFARAPFTTKAELVDDQRAHPPYGSNLTYPLERYTRFSQTSGTTGTPMRWLDTNDCWGWMVENWVEVFRASGLTAEDRIFFAFSFGPFLGFWTAFEAGTRLNCLCLPGGGMSTGARLKAILDNRVTALCCTPTYALRMGEAAREEGIDLSESSVRTIVVAGEPGAGIPSTRRRIEALWPGARLKDHHGMTEVGPVTYECPAREGVLHVLESGYIAEVIDPETGAHAGPGEEGELVLTNLGRKGSPLLRYRTGDRVRRSDTVPCACGRYDLALESGIRGRTDEMVVVRGVNLFPSAFEETVRRFDLVAEYRVEVYTREAMAEVRMHLEPAPGCEAPAQLAREVEAALRAAFNLRVPVELVPPGTLPRFELKSRRWVRLDTVQEETGYGRE